MRAFALAVTLLTALAILAPISAAWHCGGITTSQPEVTINNLYVDHQTATQRCSGLVEHDCTQWVFFYAESNGIDGLQRRDFLRDDTCHGMIPPDTLTNWQGI